MVEFAIVAPVMVYLLLGAADFARVFYLTVALNNAARAGAQFGSQSPVTAANTSGMQTAASNDATNLTLTATPTASQCTCISGTSVSTCTSTYPCSDNPNATYVSVTVNSQFKTLVKYPGFAQTITLAGNAIMQVQE